MQSETRSFFSLAALGNLPIPARYLVGSLLLSDAGMFAYEIDKLLGGSRPSIQNLLLIATCQLVAVATVAMTFIFIRGDWSRGGTLRPAQLQLGEEFEVLGLTVGFTFIGFAAAQFGLILDKWDILIFLSCCFLAVPYMAFSRERVIGRNLVQFVLIASSCSLFLIIISGTRGLFSRSDAVIAAIIPLIASIPILRIAKGEFTKRLSLTIVGAIGFATILFATVSALRSLQNFDHILNAYENQPISTAFFSTFFACLAANLCLGITFPSDRTIYVNSKWQPLNFFIFPIPYFVIFIFSIRADSLFVEGADIHWEYFVGPIRSLRAGGWLLWDVPSQYGFLNVLLPSLIPSRSAWDSFYLFQAATLFVAAALFYRFLHHLAGAGRLISLALVITTFFLAYPILIGPAPYPSSSAVRFLWCYVLLYFSAAMFLRPRPSMRTFATRGTILWLAGVLWSAESAIYGTAIFFAPILLHFLLRCMLERRLVLLDREIAELVAIPLLWLGIVLFCLGIFDYAMIGHFPDLSMFFMYGIAYAGGFGSIPINWDGPLWVFVLAFFAAGSSLRAALGDRLTAEGPAGVLVAVMACIWATASYYVGRAVPNNVVAVFPLLCFALVITLRSTAAANKLRLGIIAVSVPILSIGLVAPIWNLQILEVIQGLRAYPQRIESRLREPDPALTSLLTQAQITLSSPVVYFGFAGAMPGDLSSGVMRSYENTWLPTPLMLLEEPISPSRRLTIAQRFIGRHPKAGYFVHKRGEFELSWQAWIQLLSETHGVEKTYSNDQFEIIFFNLKT